MRNQRTQGQSGAGGLNIADYSMETADAIKYRARKATLSFKARKGVDFSAPSNRLQIWVSTSTDIDKNVGAYATRTNIINSYVTLTNEWQYFQITSALIANDVNSIGIRVMNELPIGDIAGANDYYEITNVKLEMGDRATPFVPRLYGVELALCKRYYEELNAYYLSNNTGLGGGIMFIPTQNFEVEKRIIPTVSYGPVSTPYGVAITGAAIAIDHKTRFSTGPIGVSGIASAPLGMPILISLKIDAEL